MAFARRQAGAAAVSTGRSLCYNPLTMETLLRCENCGERALESDVVCWHCGQLLPGRDRHEMETISSRENWDRSLSSKALGFYLGTTIVVLVSTLLIMSALGNRPQVDLPPAPEGGGPWKLVTDADEYFAVYLPDAWVIFDRGASQNDLDFKEALAANPLFSAGTQPLGDQASDLEIFFLAHEPAEANKGLPAFMIVARSRLLNRLSHVEAGRLLTSGDFPVSDLQIVDDFDRSHLALVSEPGSDPINRELMCHQKFMRGSQVALIMGICRSIVEGTVRRPSVEAIHETFQHLSP